MLPLALGILVRLKGKEWNRFSLDNEFMDGGCRGGDAWPSSGDSSVSDLAESSATTESGSQLEGRIAGWQARPAALQMPAHQAPRPSAPWWAVTAPQTHCLLTTSSAPPPPRSHLSKRHHTIQPMNTYYRLGLPGSLLCPRHSEVRNPTKDTTTFKEDASQ